MTPEERISTEKLIKEYAKHNKLGKILYTQVEQTFEDLGSIVNVWNVKAKSAWWIVEGVEAPMNLYPQDAFYFSADEAYSFHMGITQRLGARYQKEFKHVLDEIPLDIERIKGISRKLNLAAQQLSNAIEPEHFQSIGLTCRECLIELGKELGKRNKKLLEEKSLKSADFKGIANAFIDYYIPGEQNSDLRNYSRKFVDIAWSYCSLIVHSPNKTHPDIKIAILFTSTIVSLFENLFLKHIGFDSEMQCSECKSRDLKFIETNNRTEVVLHCNHCDHEEIFNFS